MLSKIELKKQADIWFAWFEYQHNAIVTGSKINLIFAFCDYINTLPDWQLAAELNTEDMQDIKNFRDMINNGIDFWLSGLIKSAWLQ